MPLAMLIAASRVVLGLHYPSDVLIGAAIGALLAMTGMSFYRTAPGRAHVSAVGPWRQSLLEFRLSGLKGYYGPLHSGH